MSFGAPPEEEARRSPAAGEHGRSRAPETGPGTTQPQPRGRLALVEERIRDARERGLFDRLPGQGKPLRRREKPFVPEDWRLAFDLLEEAGFAPDWLERDRAIRADLTEAHEERQRFVAWYVREGREPDLARFLDGHRRRLEKLNREIELLNLEIPRSLYWLQRPQLPVGPILETVRGACS